MEAINVFLLENPDTYPIIISLEIQCKKPCQQVMANELKRILKDKLFIPTLEYLVDEKLPSPERYVHKNSNCFL